ncbi:GAF and ANTAR domain-containing protein [Rhodococcus sp. IEGM 1379]|uniref:ANTAR domain-containing response regulator n=1 Tax=Rhodococcus sp. IEGM 1379 TaxID=3047086 RepID=UPI0024B7602B|nr:GAF and ANTAR domain-containing protein [Rhodococcus sp. IEGM 1379]MDI9915059.1 GAF and ANTAR domain-containing protein [Rhodococcus sp. IEGM 1379]
MTDRTEVELLDTDYSNIADSNVTTKLDALASALSDIAAGLGSHVVIDDLLHRVCTLIVNTISGADMAGVTLLSETGSPRTAASTDSAVIDVDLNQYASREGPCLEAARTRSVVCATVVESESRWPTFSAHLSDVGVQSFLSAPLWVDERHAGALNIYGRDPHGFSEVDALIVRVYTTSIEALLRVAREVECARNEIAGLNTAMKSRATIEQAKGILMAIRGFDSESAFRVLVAESQRSQQKLSTIAEQIVKGAEAAQ